MKDWPDFKNNIPEKGDILIAEPFVSDKYFERSVVWLADYNFIQGIMGFVLNKMVPEKLIDYFPKIKGFKDIPLFRGGPIAFDRLYFIHTLGDIIPNAYAMWDGLYSGGDFEAVKSYITSGNPVEGKIKFFLGFSGWREQQLEKEIEQHSWLVGKTEQAKIMKYEGDIFWKKSLQDLGGPYRSWANFPRRPFMN